VTPRLCLCGNLLVDDVVFSDGRVRMGEAGGAVLHAALAASLWSAEIGCLSRIGSDYPAEALTALRQRGVDLSGVRPLAGAGGRTWLLYEGTLRRMVPRLMTPTHAEVSPAPTDLPAAWSAPRAVHLAPMPQACQAALLAALPPATLVSLDPHLPVAEETLGGWRPLLDRTDVLFLGEDELLLGGAEQAPKASLRRLVGGRLRYVLWKRGAAGGLLYDAQTELLLPWAPRAAEVVDPTGCGDAFAAGFLTALLDELPLPEALLRGVVTASFALADWGAAGLLAAQPEQARKRYASWRGSP
jgi:sugar/nucleoside kinase (ribokinase family)